MLTDEQKDERGRTVGEMHKRRETMADGKRYIIYYTFGENTDTISNETPKSEGVENV